MPIAQLNWQPLVAQLKVPAQPVGGVWTCALEYVVGPRKIKIAATGSWSVIDKLKVVGPDGDSQDWDSSQALLFPGAARGVLVAKIGGGTSDKVGNIFPVGQKTVIDLTDPSTVSSSPPVRGCLFLAMNDDPKNFVRHSGEIAVDVWEAC
jgi:hypothetical protein